MTFVTAIRVCTRFNGRSETRLRDRFFLNINNKLIMIPPLPPGLW